MVMIVMVWEVAEVENIEYGKLWRHVGAYCGRTLNLVDVIPGTDCTNSLLFNMLSTSQNSVGSLSTYTREVNQDYTWSKLKKK